MPDEPVIPPPSKADLEFDLEGSYDPQSSWDAEEWEDIGRIAIRRCFAAEQRVAELTAKYHTARSDAVEAGERVLEVLAERDAALARVKELEGQFGRYEGVLGRELLRLMDTGYDFVQRLGYRACDIPACNCGSFHREEPNHDQG